MGNYEDIGNIIKDLISNSKIGREINKYNLFNHWQEIVGEEISKKSKPTRLKRGILFVSVSSSTWANELSLMSDQLVGKINSFLKEKVVNEIRFRPGL